jgi:GNAT superfamily N-acetyltransferase
MEISQAKGTASDSGISIRPLLERDLPATERVMRVAFGTFIGLPDPASFLGDASFVSPRWKADPSAAFAAEVQGEVIGSNIATNWGSVGFFGPLTIRPDYWDRKVGQRLIEPVMECFERWGIRHAGLFTFAASPKHAALYQRFGFWPRFLTAVMSKAVSEQTTNTDVYCFSKLLPEEQRAAVARCARLTGNIYEGLDVRREIDAVFAQDLGETLLLDGGLDGVAVCHCGPGTEAGSGICYVKFAAARSGDGAEQRFGRLLEAIESYAKSRSLERIVAGVSTARHESYRAMLARGFRTDLQGVAMHRPNEEGYHRPGVFAIDDWR